MSALSAAVAVAHVVLLDGGSAELEAELRASGLSVCSAPCEAAAMVRCTPDSACTTRIPGMQPHELPSATRDQRVKLAESVRGWLLERVAPLPKAADSSEQPSTVFETALTLSGIWQGGSPGISIGGRASWFAFRKIGFTVEGAVPLTSATVSATEGESSLRSWMFGWGLTLRWLDETLRLHTTFGMMAASVLVRGTAFAPYSSGSDSMWAALPFARLDSGANLGRHLFVPLSVTFGVGLPSTQITFADRPVAHWATPLVRLEAGTGYRW